MLINTFEDYNTSKLYGNDSSIFYFDSDNQDIYSEVLNNEFHSDDKPIKLENQNMHEFWNYDNMNKIQDKLLHLKQTINIIKIIVIMLYQNC